MSNEITVSASLSVYKPSVQSQADALSYASLLFNQTGSYSTRLTYLATTSATALPLGSVTSPHWLIGKNLDVTNFVKIRNGASGADLVQANAGEPFLIPLVTNSTPYVIADTASCLVEYLVAQL